jgi:RNA methyltransferase, TrmH family
MQTISSIKDPLIISARALNKKKGRTTHYLIEGEDAIQWALNADAALQHVFIEPSYNNEALLKKLYNINIDVYTCSSGIMKKINDSKYLTPIIAVAKIQHANIENDNFLLMLDDLQDQGNLGTIIRTAMALDVQNILCCHRSQDIFNKKTITASRGTVFNIQAKMYNDSLHAIQDLKQAGYQIVATSPKGKDIQSLATLEKKPITLIVGNETHGISPEVLEQADLTVKIPMQNDVESLNVGVATGISIYELKLRSIIAMLKKNIQETLGRQMGVTHKLIRRVLDQELSASSHYTAKQMILLMIMVCDVSMSLSTIEKDMSCHGDELQAILDPLIKEGCMVYENQQYSITAHGETVLAKLWSIRRAAENKIFHNFSEAETKQIIDLINKLQNNCNTLLSK